MNQLLDHYLFDAFSSASDNIFVYVCDMKTDLSRWSKRSVEYFGLEGEYIYNAGAVWLECIHPDDRDIYLKDIEAVFSGTSVHHNCQYRARNRYGDYIWVECKGSVLKDENGVPTLFAGIMTQLDNQLKYDTLTHLMTVYELQQTDFKTFEGSLLLVGVDGFRNINSQHGMMYGNKVLIRLAEVMQAKAAGGSRVYRFHGDEFVMLVRDRSPEELAGVFDDIKAACAVPDGSINPFSVSGGIVMLPEHGTDFSDIIGKAELSLAYAKDTASVHAAVFSGEIEARQNRRNKVAEALMESIKNDFEGFELYFQPIVANYNESVIGCESLLRWNPPRTEIGKCFPGEFIPILEENRGIIEVGSFVMREVIKQAAKWQRMGRKLRVSFNVSYLQLEDGKFIPELIRMADEYGVDTSLIVVELTESVFAADTQLVQEAFKKLHEHGFLIALDDFGTGNSSFWMLHNLDIDIIKLDQAFIRGLSRTGNETDYAIVESVAYLCSRINYQTVAEGVEDDDVWERIREFGFSGLQGYNFSRPVPLKEFEAFVDKYN